MKYVGITELTDAGLNYSWCDAMNDKNFAFYILITKRLNKKFCDKVLQFSKRNKIIVHMTITGYGGTIVERNVPEPEENFIWYKYLIDNGFPAKQIVFRLDPVIPTLKGIKRATNTLGKFMSFCEDNDIEMCKRVRYSFVDMYRHAIKRFHDNKLPNPYEGFNFSPSKQMIKNFLIEIKWLREYFEFESCAEYTEDRIGCISEKDCEILNIDKDVLQGNCQQRKNCLCTGNKKEITKRIGKCKHDCLYCFWK